MVFYRKYRPQIIDDLDSASVREALYAILQKDIPHAFLFTGPKGLGKTSTARIVAKVVNCTTDKKKREKELEPCGKCDQCISITNGTNVDVLEIDAASNRGIDEIRELKEKIRLAPVAAKRKVYIIDEVHMLTTEAFNALLKTLEEPPEHAMFILCTTELHKVPETIVSRCFQILFKPATEEELRRSFKRIIDAEKIDIENEALQYIVERSDRGFRDGAKLLEEVTSLANGKKITMDPNGVFSKIFSTTLNSTLFLMQLHDKDIKQCLLSIKDWHDQGIDFKHIVNRIIDDLHKMMLSKLEVTNENMGSLSELSLMEITALVKLFTQVNGDMRTAVFPQLPLEIAVIEWCEQADSNNVIAGSETTKQAQTAVGDRPATFAMTDEEVSVSSLRKQVGTMKKLKALYGEKASTEASAADDTAAILTTTVELMHTNGDGTITKEWMDLFWKNFINEMKRYNHTVAGVLRGCMIKSYKDQKLVILASYKFHKERLDDMKNREALLKISKLLTGKDIEITVELRK